MDGALIGDLVTEAAADTAGDLLGGLASDAVEGAAGEILDDGAEEVVNEADMTLFESISQSLDKYTGCQFLPFPLPPSILIIWRLRKRRLTNSRFRQRQQNPQPRQRRQQHPR